MPNWCENRLRVIGSSVDLMDFMHEFRKTDRLCEFMPMPEILVGTTSPSVDYPNPCDSWFEFLATGLWTQEVFDTAVSERRARYEKNNKAFIETGYTDWYSWCNDNWGTKWGDCETTFDEPVPFEFGLNDSSVLLVEFWFQTAWSPFGNSFMERISERFPSLVFVDCYEETGMCFRGARLFHAGLCFFDQSEDITYSSEDLDIEDMCDENNVAMDELLDSAYESFEWKGFLISGQ